MNGMQIHFVAIGHHLDQPFPAFCSDGSRSTVSAHSLMLVITFPSQPPGTQTKLIVLYIKRREEFIESAHVQEFLTVHQSIRTGEVHCKKSFLHCLFIAKEIIARGL